MKSSELLDDIEYLKDADENFCINTIRESIEYKETITVIAYTLRLLYLQMEKIFK